MSYKKATKVLPIEIVKLIQEYIDGEYIYIPKKEENKRNWGTNTSIKVELKFRNENIYTDYLNGMKTRELAEKYYLSLKSIQRIILKEKNLVCKDRELI